VPVVDFAVERRLGGNRVVQLRGQPEAERLALLVIKLHRERIFGLTGHASSSWSASSSSCRTDWGRSRWSAPLAARLRRRGGLCRRRRLVRVPVLARITLQPGPLGCHEFSLSWGAYSPVSPSTRSASPSRRSPSGSARVSRV